MDIIKKYDDQLKTIVYCVKNGAKEFKFIDSTCSSLKEARKIAKELDR